MLAVRRATESDEDLLLRWRNLPSVRQVSKSSRVVSVEEHGRWFRESLTGGNPIILMVQLHKRDLGVVRIECENHASGLWSCQLGDADAPPGFGAVLPIVALSWGFERLGLKQMKAEVLETNTRMLSIHRRLGITASKTSSRANQPLSTFCVTQESWDEIRDKAQRMLPKSWQFE